MFAALWPRRHILLYNFGDGDFVIRRYSGQVVAVASFENYDLAPGYGSGIAGGQVLFFWISCPVYGVNIRYPSVWPDMLSQSLEGVVDSRAGRILWIKGDSSCGEPIWTNGRAYIDIRYGVTRRDIHRAEKGGFLPIYLEQRRVTDRRLLWARRLRGVPPDKLVVKPRGRHSLVLRFSGGPRWSVEDGLGFIHGIPRLTVSMPLLAGQPTGESVKIYPGVW